VATAGVNGMFSMLPLTTSHHRIGILLARAYVIKTTNGSNCISLFYFFGVICYLGCIGAMLAQMAVTRCNEVSSLQQQTIIGAIVTGINLFLDLLVFIIIAIHLGNIWKEDKFLQSKVAKQMLKQGQIRFGIVLIWSLANLVSSLLVRVTIAGIDGPLENAVSQILICQFQLDLIKQVGGESITVDFGDPLTFRLGSWRQSAGLTSDPSNLYGFSPERVV